jgi:hypothetical protein
VSWKRTHRQPDSGSLGVRSSADMYFFSYIWNRFNACNYAGMTNSAVNCAQLTPSVWTMHEVNRLDPWTYGKPYCSLTADIGENPMNTVQIAGLHGTTSTAMRPNMICIRSKNIFLPNVSSLPHSFASVALPSANKKYKKSEYSSFDF